MIYVDWLWSQCHTVISCCICLLTTPLMYIKLFAFLSASGVIFLQLKLVGISQQNTACDFLLSVGVNNPPEYALFDFPLLVLQDKPTSCVTSHCV